MPPHLALCHASQGTDDDGGQGTGAAENAERDATFFRAVEELRAMEVAHEVLGGGRIQFEPDAKTIHIYGHSMGFPWQGEYRHDLSAKVCQEAYPDFAVTTSNEGY